MGPGQVTNSDSLGLGSSGGEGHTTQKAQLSALACRVAQCYFPVFSSEAKFFPLECLVGWGSEGSPGGEAVASLRAHYGMGIFRSMKAPEGTLRRLKGWRNAVVLLTAILAALVQCGVPALLAGGDVKGVPDTPELEFWSLPPNPPRLSPVAPARFVVGRLPCNDAARSLTSDGPLCPRPPPVA